MLGQIVLPKNNNNKLEYDIQNMNDEEKVSKYKKLRSLIQKVVNINETKLSQKEYGDFRIEYEEVIQKSVIPKGNDETIDEVWNFYTIQKVTDPD